MDERIVIAEDDEDLLDNLTEILEEEGWTVTGCRSAEQALESVKAACPALVLLDNMMPGMGGMAVLPLLRRESPAMKIVMMTAFSTVDNAVAAMKSGADDYLAKPFKKQDLVMTIRRNLEEARFSHCIVEAGLDDTLACVANPIRRQILKTIHEHGCLRFMDICRLLGMEDHTKMNFHLKNLKVNELLTQDREKRYHLSRHGENIVGCLQFIANRIGGNSGY